MEPNRPINLERLTERHLALTESVESLLLTVREQSGIVNSILAATKANTDHIRAIVGIIESHENRLQRFEGDNPS